MNGVDYNDDMSTVTVQFVGTGQGMSIMVIIMGALIFALLIISIIVFLFGLQTLLAAQNTKSELDNEESRGSNNPRGSGGGGAGGGTAGGASGGGAAEGGQPGSASSQQRAGGA